MRAAVRCVSDSRRPATTSWPTERPSACSGPGVVIVFGAGDVERPQRDVAAEAIAAGDLAVALAIGGVEIGAARDRHAVAQRRIGKGRQDLRQHRRRRRREIVRDELLEQIAGEFRKLVLELELHARGEEGRAFEQAGDHRIHALGDQAAEPLGDARIFLGEFPGLLVQQQEFSIVEIEKFPVHVARAG